jgi:L-arabinose isomerase
MTKKIKTEEVGTTKRIITPEGAIGMAHSLMDDMKLIQEGIDMAIINIHEGEVKKADLLLMTLSLGLRMRVTATVEKYTKEFNEGDDVSELPDEVKDNDRDILLKAFANITKIAGNC